MRKIVILAVVLLVVGAFFVQRRLNVEIDPAAFLPTDTVVYTDQREGEARGQRFLASPLGKAITAIDLPALARDLDTPADVRADLEKKIGDCKDFINQNQKLLAELFGDHFVIAVLPRRDWMQEAGVVPDARRQLIVFSKPRHGTTAIELLSSAYSGNLQTEIAPYGKYSLKRFRNDEISFVACAVNGWLLAAFEERTLRESLDIFDAKKGSLAESENFRKITADLAESEQIVYLRLNGLAELARDFLAGIPMADQVDQAALAELFNVEAGLDGFAYGSQMRDSILEERMLISLVPDKASAAVRKILEATPAKDDILPHLSDSLLFYSYTNVTDWSTLGDLSAKNRAMVENFSGHSLGELQKILGDGASRLFVKKGEDGQTLPLPLVNFCVAAAVPETLDATASSLLAKAGIDMTKGKFQDATYQAWSGSKVPGKNLRLYSALWRGHWCVGNSLDFFQEIVEPSPEAASLVAAKDFKAVDNGINEPAQSLMYIRVDQSLDLLRDACGWLATFLALESKDLPSKANLVNERLIFPILEGAKMYKRSLNIGGIKDNMLKIDCRTSIAPAESK
ncbi:MAG TPA: hypothetical protein DEB25_01250 [Desulfobulbaceae bacterium]|nr:hypothetical protein [Desulfobulbaceae bacterium]